MRLAEFNGMTDAAATAAASVWAAVPSWAAGVVAARPYASVDELAETAAAQARTWTRPDLGSALAHHPRIGERPAGSTAEADASRREQSSMSAAGDDISAAFRQGNAAYERRFGRVFLIRAADRSPEEMLAELERRLTNDDETEASEALAQLAEIALLRLRGALTADERIPS